MAPIVIIHGLCWGSCLIRPGTSLNDTERGRFSGGRAGRAGLRVPGFPVGARLGAAGGAKLRDAPGGLIGPVGGWNAPVRTAPACGGSRGEVGTGGGKLG